MSEAPLTYKLDNNTLSIIIKFPAQLIVGDNSSKGVVVNAINTTLSLSINEKKPIDLLTSLQENFKNLIKFDQGTLLDTAVSNTMVMIGNLSNSSGTLDMNVVKRNKAFAKYYYKAFISKDIQGVENSTNPMKDTVKIVIDLFTWWYIRRLVHIFVVFTIIETLSKPLTTVSSPTVIMPMPTNSPPSVASTQTTTATIDDAEVQKLKDTVKSLQDVIASQTTSITDKDTQLKSLQSIQADIDKLKDEVTRKTNEALDWKTKHDNLRELLIHSTSMIFKFDEVPNLLIS